jgi:hypothetical protein
MDTLNLNMKAPTGVFRKFHGKELDLNNSCKSDWKFWFLPPSNLKAQPF